MEEREIEIENKKINYTLKKSKRAKHVILNVGCDAKVSVTIPWHSSEIWADTFIQKKSNWLFGKIKYFKTEGRSLIPGPDQRDYLKNKKLAQEIVEKKLKRFNAFYNFSFGKVTIRNQKTRWGSCSKKGDLSFCYRVIYLPDELSDYIVVHELCHLKEFNHGRDFWRLVEKTLPDARKLRRKVRAM